MARVAAQAAVVAPMKWWNRFRLWCARPYLDQAQASHNADLAVLNAEAAVLRLELATTKLSESTAYWRGWLMGDQQARDTVLAQIQEIIDEHNGRLPTEEELAPLRWMQ